MSICHSSQLISFFTNQQLNKPSKKKEQKQAGNNLRKQDESERSGLTKITDCRKVSLSIFYIVNFYLSKLFMFAHHQTKLNTHRRKGEEEKVGKKVTYANFFFLIEPK